ncbi:hypothetical protein P8C59_009107 [Phyllachora maydis]|uniref:NAD-dependent epimerase/dehydratase domain-containing protein n=1 Tax=Phyllachora maydis TaxID=1825666 RepID=A0AAD9IDZ3_9PEZI|nr:hypothetical protein P8C59_009107 [Phyllachora maydis]
MSPSFDRLSPGDLVLMTGVSGLIGSTTARALLDAGFRVRGITRDLSRVTELSAKFGADAFEAVEMADITKPEPFAPHLQGVAGVVHVANDTSWDPSPRRIIDTAVDSTLSLMKAAAAVPSVQAFVLTSSRSVASARPTDPEAEVVLTADSWVDGVTEQLFALDAGDSRVPALSYVASKYEGEKAAWAYYRAARPRYAFNAVLPDYVLGVPANPRPGCYSTYSFFMQFYAERAYEWRVGPNFFLFTSPPGCYVSARDTACLHVVALAAREVQGERVYAATAPWDALEAAEAIHKADPAWEVPEAVKGADKKRKFRIPTDRFSELLQKYYGREADRLDDIVREVIEAQKKL